MFLCQKSNTAQSNRVQNSMFDDLNSDSICPASWLVYLGVAVSSCCVTKYLPESVGLADSASRSRLAGASSRRKLCSLYPPWNSWPARTVFLIRGSVWRAGEEAKTCGHTPQAMPTLGFCHVCEDPTGHSEVHGQTQNHGSEMSCLSMGELPRQMTMRMHSARGKESPPHPL